MKTFSETDFAKKILKKIRALFSEGEENKVGDAFETIREKLASDPGYAWSLHCNIAMPIKDASNTVKAFPVTHEEANLYAQAVMDHLFCVKCISPNLVQVREPRKS